MIQEEKNNPVSQSMGLVSIREKELENLKRAVFRYWDRFEGGISDTFLKVFPIKDSFIDTSIAYKWLLEWNGGIEVVISKMKELVGKTFDIRDPLSGDYSFDYGSYDFKFEIENIDHINKDDYNSSIFLNIIVDGDGTLSMIFNDPQDQGPYTINQVMETEEAWEVKQEIKDLVDDWFFKGFEKKYGVKIHINKVYID